MVVGSQAGTIFDTDKITVANEAKAGRSTRTYLEETAGNVSITPFNRATSC